LDDKEVYEILFDLMENSALSESVWNLLRHMPPSKELLRKILAIGLPLPSDAPAFPWNELLHENNPYQLLYVLQIVEFMMEESEDQIKKLIKVIFETTQDQNSENGNCDVE
jgi:hypothetical protein